MSSFIFMNFHLVNIIVLLLYCSLCSWRITSQPQYNHLLYHVRGRCINLVWLNMALIMKWSHTKFNYIPNGWTLLGLPLTVVYVVRGLALISTLPASWCTQYVTQSQIKFEHYVPLCLNLPTHRTKVRWWLDMKCDDREHWLARTPNFHTAAVKLTPINIGYYFIF